VVAFLQAAGGIRDTEGHDLRNLIGQRQNPRHGPLLRESGLSVDEAGEALHEAGYFGDPAATPRPTEAEVVDLIREAGGRKVYSVRDTGAALDAKGIDTTQARDLAANELGRAVEETGVKVSEANTAAAVDLMMTKGLPASDALDEVLERSAIEGGVYADRAQKLSEVETKRRKRRRVGLRSRKPHR
jgi:hypothetical protein